MQELSFFLQHKGNSAFGLPCWFQWTSLFIYPTSPICYWWISVTGWEKKEDGKPCVTSMTIICWKKIHLPLKRSFCKRPENINDTCWLWENTQVIALSHSFDILFPPAVLLCKLTIVKWGPLGGVSMSLVWISSTAIMHYWGEGKAVL